MITNFEKSQPDGLFFRAGNWAFRMGINVYANPYKDINLHKLWDRGWRSAKKRDNTRGTAKYA